jgi:cytochrome c2
MPDNVWTPARTWSTPGASWSPRCCYGCHEIDKAAFTDLPKIGPDLRKVASKTNDGWAAKWVEAPREFRPTTFMPHFFFQENIEGDQNKAFQRAEIESAVDYLWSKSEHVSYTDPPGGDAGRGEALFNPVGCTVPHHGRHRHQSYSTT